MSGFVEVLGLVLAVGLGAYNMHNREQQELAIEPTSKIYLIHANNQEKAYIEHIDNIKDGVQYLPQVALYVLDNFGGGEQGVFNIDCKTNRYSTEFNTTFNSSGEKVAEYTNKAFVPVSGDDISMTEAVDFACLNFKK